MNLSALPDDPTRTADYGYFPWETEDESQPITEAEAVTAVMACLSGHMPEAYGESHEYWCEVLLDQICEPEDFRIAFLSLLGHGIDAPSATRNLRKSLRRFIHNHACSLLGN